MTIGYYDISKIRRIEQRAESVGFKFASPKYGGRSDTAIGLRLINNEVYPVYSRDTEIFVGSLDDINSFLDGMIFMKNYLAMLKIITDKKVQHAEGLVRQKQLIDALKNAGVNNGK